MSMRFSLSLLLSLVGTLVEADGPNTWVSMFNGKTLEGWTQKNGLAHFDSRDGHISGTPPRTGSDVSYLCTVGEFSDFELELDVRLDSRFGEAFPSAVQIRSHASTGGDDSSFKPGSVHGPQVKIAYTGETGESGRIFLNSTNTRPAPLTLCEPHSNFEKRSWNSIRVVAIGPRIQTFVNGKKVDDLTDEKLFEKYPSGFIGLQVCPTPSVLPSEGKVTSPLILWRNLRIKPFQ
jgi:hypothetical protein